MAVFFIAEVRTLFYCCFVLIFYRASADLTRDFDIANLSVCLSVVTFWYQIKTA